MEAMPSFPSHVSCCIDVAWYKIASNSVLVSFLLSDHRSLYVEQGKGVYQFVKKYGANVDGYR
jgi:hypothetical protein